MCFKYYFNIRITGPKKILFSNNNKCTQSSVDQHNKTLLCGIQMLPSSHQRKDLCNRKALHLILYIKWKRVTQVWNRVLFKLIPKFPNAAQHPAALQTRINNVLHNFQERILSFWRCQRHQLCPFKIYSNALKDVFVAKYLFLRYSAGKHCFLSTSTEKKKQSMIGLSY